MTLALIQKCFAILRNGFLILYALFALFPLFWMLLISFKQDRDVYTTGFIFSPTFQNYANLIADGVYVQFFLNNIIVSGGAVLLSIIVGVPAAYAFARFNFKGRESLAFTLLSFRFAPEILVILPLFLIYQQLGLYNTYFGLIWVLQLITLPLIVWILRGYFEEISPEIEHAARVDGYPWWQVFLKILMPLIKPGLVASALLSFIFAWNNFTFPLLLGSQDVMTTTVGALRYISSETVQYGQMAAAVTIATIPQIILALLIQKHLVRGLSMGAVKG